MSFPLYDNIKQLYLTEKYHNKEVDVKLLFSILNKLTKEHYTIIYYLIFHHFYINGGSVEYNKYMSNSDNKKKFVPYNGKVPHGGKGVIYPLKNLPLELLKYLEIYIHSVCTIQ